MAALLAVVVAPFPQGTASASCAAPYLKDVERLVLQRVTTVSIEGRAFTDGCQDTMTCSTGLGCQSCEHDEPPPVPMQDVDLQLRQHARTWRLGTADAQTAADNHLGRVRWTFALPAGVEPGRARLVAEGAQPVEVRVLPRR